MIRILSIEDHWMVVDGLKSRFRGDRDDMSNTCSAETIEEALTVDYDLFDLILLDLLIPGTDPVENVQRLKKRYPAKPIIILTSEERTVWEDQMCEAGVQAYLTKHDTRQNIKTVIKQVSQGQDFCRLRLLDLNLISALPDPVNWVQMLKPHEEAILTMFSKEMRLKEIATTLNMTESAVGKTMAKLRKQFHVKSNTGLIRVLLDQKIL